MNFRKKPQFLFNSDFRDASLGKKLARVPSTAIIFSTARNLTKTDLAGNSRPKLVLFFLLTR